MLIISTLLFIVILLFTTLSTIHRIKLFSDDYVTVGRVLEGYVAIVGVLLGLVIFIGLNTFFPNINHIASKVVAVVAWFVVTLLLYTVPNNNNETLMEFLWKNTRQIGENYSPVCCYFLAFYSLLLPYLCLVGYGWV
jgi:uncharacterized protein YacL